MITTFQSPEKITEQVRYGLKKGAEWGATTDRTGLLEKLYQLREEAAQEGFQRSKRVVLNGYLQRQIECLIEADYVANNVGKDGRFICDMEAFIDSALEAYLPRRDKF